MSQAIVSPSEFLPFGMYLEAEENAEERHEYVDGRVFAMAGASEAHEIVALNLASAINIHLKGSPCRTFKGDMKLRIEIQGRELVYYPDIMVTCDPGDNLPLFKQRPKLLIEVMSDYKTDHIEKLLAYQQIDTLEEYLVVDQDPEQRRAWLYRRETGWRQENGATEDRITLSCIGFEIELKAVYV